MFRPAAVFRNSAVVVSCGQIILARKKAMIYTPGEMTVITLTPEMIHQACGESMIVSIERNE